MRSSLLLALALLPAVAMNANAQNPNPQDPVYVVSYIEAAPSSHTSVANALKQLATASRKDDGNMRYEILQRTAPGNQFAIVSTWKNQAAYDAHATAAHTKEFRDKNRPHLISAIDDRAHNALEIGAGDLKGAPGAIYVVTHVDVPPPRKDECIAALKALVADSRKEANAVRFEVFQQTSRPNHFTVVEVWKSEKAYDDHITAPHTIKFRDQLTPMSGALYDERLYKAM
jgi:quinol monooxygenase YgiN